MLQVEVVRLGEVGAEVVKLAGGITRVGLDGLGIWRIRRSRAD
jgi:hypothetical protein